MVELLEPRRKHYPGHEVPEENEAMRNPSHGRHYTRRCEYTSDSIAELVSGFIPCD